MPENEDKNEKKSIDEILSDLNNLLNRMPQILEGIKLPDMKPIDFDQMAINDIKKEEETPAAPDAADEKTLVFTLEPETQAVSVEAQIAEFAPETSIVPSQIAKEAEEILPETVLPAAAETAQVEKGPEFVVENDDSFLKLADITASETGGTVPSEPERPAEVSCERERENKVLESTGDFGAPDIEALLKMAENKKEVPQSENVPSPGFDRKRDDGGEMSEEKKENLDGGGEEELKIDLSAAPNTAQAGISDTIRDGEKKEGIPEPAGNASPDAEKTVVFNVDFDSGEKGNAQPPQEQAEAVLPEPANTETDAEKTVVFNAEPGSPENSSEQVPQEQPRAEDELQVLSARPENHEPAPQTEPAPANNAPSGEPNLGISIEPNPQEPANIQLETPGSAELSLELPSRKDSLEEKTLFVEPAKEGEATVVFTGAQSCAPSGTSRSSISQGDLQAVIDRIPPDTVLPERIKPVGFIYSSDISSIFSVLKSIDEICLASAEKSMFAKRSFVLNFTPEMSANYLTQRISETGSVALVAVGEFPQEKLYELETVFNTAGVLFKNLIPSNFSKSAAIDFVIELVLR